MLGLKKKARGTDLINEVAGRFDSMIEDLDAGILDCQQEQANVRAQIELLRERNVSLDSSVSKAFSIATNLRKLIGE